MKKLLLTLSLFLFLATPVLADTNCPDDLYYFDTNVKACIHKSGGFLDENNTCQYAFDPVDNSLCNQIVPQKPTTCTYPEQHPDGVYTCTGTLQGDKCMYDPNTPPNCQKTATIPPLPQPPNQTPVSNEEMAVYHLGQGLLPTEVDKAQKDKNLLDQIISLLTNNFLTQIFFHPPQDKGKFYTQSEKINQASVPNEVKPQDNNFLNNLQGFLGKNTGVYGLNFPDFSQPIEVVKGFEKQYEQANFPDGVNPITK
ncbi:hypothetical protein HY389_02180 [Candidatus Daviesbacteria bacterium]|nr:hypothetical protein [Candidatus Daviesbacteria bacterium]